MKSAEITKALAANKIEITKLRKQLEAARKVRYELKYKHHERG